jgi:hypothetical protein
MKFTIKIEIPKEWYVAQGELEIGFPSEMTSPSTTTVVVLTTLRSRPHAAAVACRRGRLLWATGRRGWFYLLLYVG